MARLGNEADPWHRSIYYLVVLWYVLTWCTQQVAATSLCQEESLFHPPRSEKFVLVLEAARMRKKLFFVFNTPREASRDEAGATVGGLVCLYVHWAGWPGYFLFYIKLGHDSAGLYTRQYLCLYCVGSVSVLFHHLDQLLIKAVHSSCISRNVEVTTSPFMLSHLIYAHLTRPTNHVTLLGGPREKSSASSM